MLGLYLKLIPSEFLLATGLGTFSLQADIVLNKLHNQNVERFNIKQNIALGSIISYKFATSFIIQL